MRQLAADLLALLRQRTGDARRYIWPQFLAADLKDMRGDQREVPFWQLDRAMQDLADLGYVREVGREECPTCHQTTRAPHWELVEGKTEVAG